MGKGADETQDDAQDSLDPLPSPAIEAESREGKPIEAATPGADDDDEYEMVELSELVDVPKAGDENIGDTPAFEAAASTMDAESPSEAHDDGEAGTTRPADVALNEITAESSESDLTASESDVLTA